MIDKSVSDSAINADERAVVEKYNFNLSAGTGGHFVLVDPEYRRQNKGKGGRHEGGNLSILLTAAVAQHKTLEQASKAPSDQVDKQAARAKTNPPKTKVSGAGNIPETDEHPGLVVTSLQTGKTTVIQPPGTVAPKTPVSAALTDVDDKTQVTAPAPVKRTERVRDATPTTETSDELEARLKAAKKAKAKEPKAEKKAKAPKPEKERKDNRYLRAARLIAKKPSITAEQLAEKADMSESTAGHCIDAWRGVTAALLEKGWLSPEHLTK